MASSSGSSSFKGTYEVGQRETAGKDSKDAAVYTTAIELPNKYDPQQLHDLPDDYTPGYTANDQKDMGRMGKKQELRRQFRQISMISLTCLMMFTWECEFVANYQGLVDGGIAGLFWSYVWTFLGFGLVIASLAEMASMAPTAGGQYHWVSEFAPPKYQKFLSYMTGWMSALSWQAGQASGVVLNGLLVQGLVVLNIPSYSAPAYQGVLITFAMVAVIFVGNTWAIRLLPLMQNILMWIHVSLFFTVMIMLWVLAPQNSAKKVFTEFSNYGGWSTVGLSLMIGQITSIYSLCCSDAAAHLSEETTDAGKTVPRAIWWGYVLNAIMGLVFLFSFIFALDDVYAAINDPSGYPWIYVFHKIMPNTNVGTNAVAGVYTILGTMASISFNASASRQTWSFARDRGLPFSRWIAHVNPKMKVPVNSVIVSCLFSCLMALINLGSNDAFNAIISLQLVALMLTYVTSIGCVLYRRITAPHLLPNARWSLGRLGKVINIGAIIYAVFAFFWCFWPNTTVASTADFNWAVVMFIGILVFSLFMYVVKGRFEYAGPVVLVAGRDDIRLK